MGAQEPLPELLKALPMSSNESVMAALSNIHAVYPLNDITDSSGTAYGSSNPDHYVAALRYFMESAEQWWKNYDTATQGALPTSDLGVTSSVYMRVQHQQTMNSLRKERSHLVSSLMNFLEENSAKKFKDASGAVYYGAQADSITRVELVRSLFLAVGNAHGIDTAPVFGISA